jgi:HEAT repeats
MASCGGKDVAHSIHVDDPQNEHESKLTVESCGAIDESGRLGGQLDSNADAAVKTETVSNCNMSEVSNLLNTICRNDGAGRVEAAITLVNARVNSDDVSKLIMVYNNTDDEFVHCMIIRSLRNAGSSAKRAEPILLNALDHPAGDIRHSAMSALGCLKQNAGIQTVAKLSSFLSHKNSLDRYQAAQALADIGPAASPALTDLLQLLEDPKPSIRLIAIHAMTEVASPSDKRVDERLSSIAKNDEDEDVRNAAREAIKRLHTKEKHNPALHSCP